MLDHNCDKYIRTENFTATLKEAKQATNNNIDDFLKETDFDDILKNLKKKVTLNKTRHLKCSKERFQKTQYEALQQELSDKQNQIMVYVTHCRLFW